MAHRSAGAGGDAPARTPLDPGAGRAGAPRESIDRFVAEALSAQGKPFPRPVSDRVFLRRVHLDLWGLLPSPEEVESFLWEEDDGKRERRIRALLADSDRYAEH